MSTRTKTARIKSILAWLTSFLLVAAAWTLQFQMKPLAGVLVIGIIGTLLIFSAEFVYSYRKSRRIKFGSIRTWLRLHIAAGIIGPLLILWHTGFNFYGFAGWLALLTAVVVLSGFIGRYIYRQIPRSLKGRELRLKEIKTRIKKLNGKIKEKLAKNAAAEAALKELRSNFPGLMDDDKNTAAGGSESGWLLMWVDWYIGRFKSHKLLTDPLIKQTLQLELRRLRLIGQIRALKTSKTMLKKWKLMHVPLTLTLFTGVLIHIGGVFYYGKLWP